MYAVYSDVTSQMQMEQELTAANEKMQDIINAIPGGVAIYKVSDIFETVYFSDGVPELSGDTVAEYQEMVKRDAAEMTYWEDTEMVVARAQEVIQSLGTARSSSEKSTGTVPLYGYGSKSNGSARRTAVPCFTVSSTISRISKRRSWRWSI